MKRILAILATLLAVLSVSMPSLAASARGLSPHPAPVVVLQANGTYTKAPCPLGGTGRLMVCQTDIGLLPLSQAILPETADPQHALSEDRLRRGIASAPRLPPPKQA